MRQKSLSSHHAEQLLDVLGFYMDQDLRAKVAAEVPQAYNAWIGSKVCKVVNARHGWEYDNPSENTEEKTAEYKSNINIVG
jgi:hypothetical protein